jgi:hypothetical protein
LEYHYGSGLGNGGRLWIRSSRKDPVSMAIFIDINIKELLVLTRKIIGMILIRVVLLFCTGRRLPVGLSVRYLV